MTTFIDEQRARWGVEPICLTLAVAPSSYYAAKTRAPSARAIRDKVLSADITRIHAAHFSVCAFPSGRIETLDSFMDAAEVTVDWVDADPARVARDSSTFWPTFRCGDRRLVSPRGFSQRDDHAAFAATARDVVLAEQRPTEEHWRVGGWDGQDPDAPTATEMHRASRSARRQMRKFLGPVLYLRLIESVIVADDSMA